MQILKSRHLKTSIEMHISYININYKRFAGDCFEMNSSAVQLNLRFCVIPLGESEYIFASFPENGTFASIVSPVLL